MAANTPTTAQLVSFLGWGTPDQERTAQLSQHLSWATAVVTAYVGRHNVPEVNFGEWAPGIPEVILSLAGRSVSNPTSAEYLSANTIQSKPGMPMLTLAERMLLDNYRTTSA